MADTSTQPVGGAPFPPRPKAIATFLASDDFLPGCQTLLHSIKTHLVKAKDYPPETVVLLSSKLSNSASVKSQLQFFCDRIIIVDHIPILRNSTEDNSSHVQQWDENCGWTKLHCLVIKDVSHLLHIDDNETTKRVGLLAAAPDIFPPDKFNAGVMVLRPSKTVFDDMMNRIPNETSNRNSNQQLGQCKSYDGGDTGFLNAYYPTWYNSMPPYSRLSFGYNAQRFMHHCTFEKQPKYWNEAIADLSIIHFSSSPKPWEVLNGAGSGMELVEGSVVDKVRQCTTGALESLWQKSYEQSQQYYNRQVKKQHVRQSEKKPSSAKLDNSKPKTKLSPHQMVQRRYKELRKMGHSTSQAMEKARDEYGMNVEYDPCRAVGQMFGL
eukprot:scaffold16528_cov79-Cyclotella_meneghiniana.AAC.3